MTKLGQRGYAVHGEPGEYRTGRIDPDTETDADPEGKRAKEEANQRDPDTETDPDPEGKRAKEEANQRFQRTDYRR